MADWITGVTDSLGYVGVFLLLALARVVPPVPAETVIPLAGMEAANGTYNLLGIALAGGLGSAAGELIWYLPSRLYGRDRLLRFLHRHGHWLTVRPDQVDRASDWFERRGTLAVLLCQPFPGLRTLISIPAGAYRMPALRFYLYAAAGSSTWLLVLAVGGYLLQSTWPKVADYMGLFVLGLLGVLVMVYIVRVILQVRRS